MLPPVCAKTGRPADRFLAMRARTQAGWTWLLLPLGVLPFLTVRHFAREVTIQVPLAERVLQQLEHLRLGGLVALLETVILAGVGLIAGCRHAVLGAVAFLAAAAFMGAIKAARSVRPRLDLSARTVVLSGVHPVFRDEVDRLQRIAWSYAAGSMSATTPGGDGGDGDARGT
jgi:hypothetical protein